MAKKIRIDKDLLRKKTPSQPTAEYLEQEFYNFLEYCEERDKRPTKHAWRVFLNVLDGTYNNWLNATRNTQDVSEEEFNDRRTVIKKIDKYIEESLSDELLESERTNGNLMFYLKNSYKWTDRPQQEELSVTIKTKGTMSKRDKK